MGDFFSGFDLNVRLEEDEDENLPFDVNDGNGNATVTLWFCFLVLWTTLILVRFQNAEPEDDDGNNFFDLDDPPLGHDNGMNKVVCSSSMHVN